MAKPGTDFRFGFVALVGRPNTGKSTLTNALVGETVSITADKPQTTRHNVRGIITTEQYQAVLIDTPGIHDPRGALHDKIVRYALDTLYEADAVLMVAEPVLHSDNTLKDDDRRVIEALRQARGPVFLVMNKTDLYNPEQMMLSTKVFWEAFPFKDCFPVSALKEKGLERLNRVFSQHLPVGMKLFPDDMPTDMPMRSLAAEIIRESIFRLTSQEIPYSCTVVVDKFEEFPGLCRLYATIVVGRQNHKQIIIGRQGQAIRRIGSVSRRKIQSIMYKKVFLDLHVKVVERWYDDARRLHDLGYT